MPFDSAVLDAITFGNSLRTWLTAGLAFLVFQAAALFLKNVVLDRLKRLAARTETDFDDALVAALASIRGWELAVVAAYLGARSLFLPGAIDKGLHLTMVLVASFRGAMFLQAILHYSWRKATAAVHEGDPTARSALSNLEYVLTGGVWLGAALFVLDNLGVNITTAVAGLGIGGIAVAMAAQQILGDLFSSFVIFMDKPFAVGDVIVVDGLTGTVENVGLKTTSVRSLSGEMLVFANSDLTKSRIRNFQRLRERRIVWNLAIPYGTPRDKVAAVPHMIRDAFKGLEKVRFERAHLKNFGAAALEYEAVYFVLSDDYELYMNLNQRACLSLLERFEAEGVSFALPAQTVFVAGPKA